MNITERLLEFQKEVSTWIYKNTFGIKPAKAMDGGIPKDPSYKPKEVFFVDGIGKFTPKTPTTPNIRPVEDDGSIKGFMESLKQWVDLHEMLYPTVGQIDTKDGSLSPAEYFDQYLTEVEGGKDALLKEVQANFARNKDNLPWKMDPKNRDRRFPVDERDGALGFFDQFEERVAVGKANADGHLGDPIINPELQTGAVSNFSKSVREFNGLPKEKGTITAKEVIGHELGHAYTFDRDRIADFERLPPLSEENPYFFGIGEEYKVGALTFLNKSRQLTGKKLTDPQEIHQLFDEIEKDPAILDKNYSVEEARLPRTYLLLKKTNPQGAEVLRNAAARDCQYLAKSTEEIAKQTTLVANTKGPKMVDKEIIACIGAIDQTQENLKDLPNLLTKINSPIEKWATELDKYAGGPKTKQTKEHEFLPTLA
jgi:hypothetical protein